MSRVTGLHYVNNQTDQSIEFTNGENSAHHRIIPAKHNTSIGDCWIPWREDDGVDMDTKRLILQLSSEKVYYIWQHNHHIRYSLNTDPRTANGGSIVPGDSNVGRSKRINVTSTGVLDMHNF